MSYRIVIIIALLLASFYGEAQKIHLKREKNGYWIMEDNKRVFFFNRDVNDSVASHARNNYFHPVYDLNGNCITEDFPADHLHQRGIFWAWLQLIVDGQHVADGWHLQNFTQEIDQVEFLFNDKGQGVFSYSSFWELANRPDNPIMRENTKVVVYPRTAHYRRIDFTIELHALEHNLKIGGADNEKGYGGFAIRLKTDDNTVFTDLANNRISPQELAIDAGLMVDVSNPAMKSGVSILAWDENPGKTQWILRQSKSAQNAAWPGREPINISVTKPTVLKYSVIIHKGNRKRVPYKQFAFIR
jgi:hypothetical protein